MKVQHAINPSKTLLKCALKIKTRNGQKFVYYGLFHSTTEAVIDAIQRFEIASLSVQKITTAQHPSQKQLKESL